MPTTFDFSGGGSAAGPFSENGNTVNGAPEFHNSYETLTHFSTDRNRWELGRNIGEADNNGFGNTFGGFTVFFYAAGTAQAGPPLGEWLTYGAGNPTASLSNKQLSKTFHVAGAGDPAFIGDYPQMNQNSTVAPAYQLDGTHYLVYSGTYWFLALGANYLNGEVQYRSATCSSTTTPADAGGWYATTGATPAPVVTEVASGGNSCAFTHNPITQIDPDDLGPLRFYFLENEGWGGNVAHTLDGEAGDEPNVTSYQGTRFFEVPRAAGEHTFTVTSTKQGCSPQTDSVTVTVADEEGGGGEVGPFILEVVGESLDGSTLAVKMPGLPSGAVSWALDVTPASGTPQTIAGISGGATSTVTDLVAPRERHDVGPSYTLKARAVDGGGATVAQSEEVRASPASLAPPPAPPLPGTTGLDTLVFRGFSQNGQMVEIGMTARPDMTSTIAIIRSASGEQDARFLVSNWQAWIPVEVDKHYTLRAVASNTTGETISAYVLKVFPHART